MKYTKLKADVREMLSDLKAYESVLRITPLEGEIERADEVADVISRLEYILEKN